jgi:hypothetical protein
MVDSVAAMADSAEAMPTRHPRAGSVADARLAEAGRSTAVGDITAAEHIMAVAVITAPVSDSVSAFTRLMDMPLRSAALPDSMTEMACGSTIPAAPFRTDINRTNESDCYLSHRHPGWRLGVSILPR